MIKFYIPYDNIKSKEIGPLFNDRLIFGYEAWPGNHGIDCVFDNEEDLLAFKLRLGSYNISEHLR